MTRMTIRLLAVTGLASAVCREQKYKVALLLLCSLAASRQPAAGDSPYALSFHTIGGVGGSSSGGSFIMSATICEVSAGGLGGAEFGFNGGFWSATLQPLMPSAPLLSVGLSSNSTLVVSWPSPSAGWFLQQSSDLSATNWTNVSLAITDNGTSKSVILNSSFGNLYLRLKQ